MRGQFSSRLCLAVFQLVIWPTAAAFIAGAAGVRLNLTASVPIGLYLIGSGPEFHFIDFCPPEPFGSLSVKRSYRARSTSCPDNGESLLKPIIAVEGDLVEVSPSGISVNGLPIPNTLAAARDTAGRALSSWPSGIYLVAPRTVWVASSHNSGSFDSRYFGPIRVTDIRHHLRSLWTEQ